MLTSIQRVGQTMKGLVKLAVDSHEYIIRVLIRKIIIKGVSDGNVEAVKLLVGWSLMNPSSVGA
jgi:hypothetical protein